MLNQFSVFALKEHKTWTLFFLFPSFSMTPSIFKQHFCKLLWTFSVLGVQCFIVQAKHNRSPFPMFLEGIGLCKASHKRFRDFITYYQCTYFVCKIPLIKVLTILEKECCCQCTLTLDSASPTLNGHLVFLQIYVFWQSSQPLEFSEWKRHREVTIGRIY